MSCRRSSGVSVFFGIVVLPETEQFTELSLGAHMGEDLGGSLVPFQPRIVGDLIIVTARCAIVAVSDASDCDTRKPRAEGRNRGCCLLRADPGSRLRPRLTTDVSLS